MNRLGEIFLPQSLFHDFMHEIAPRFTPDEYSLLKHNCNNFTNECTNFSLGTNIPDCMCVCFVSVFPFSFVRRKKKHTACIFSQFRDFLLKC